MCAPSGNFSHNFSWEAGNASEFGMQLCFGVLIGTEGFDLYLFRGAMDISDRYWGFLHSFVTVDFAHLLNLLTVNKPMRVNRLHDNSRSIIQLRSYIYSMYSAGIVYQSHFPPYQQN